MVTKEEGTPALHVLCGWLLAKEEVGDVTDVGVD